MTSKKQPSNTKEAMSHSGKSPSDKSPSSCLKEDGRPKAINHGRNIQPSADTEYSLPSSRKKWFGIDITQELNRLPTALAHFRERTGTLDDAAGFVLYTLCPFFFFLPILFIVLVNSELTIEDTASRLSYEIIAPSIFALLLWISTRCLPRMASFRIWLIRLGLVVTCTAIFSMCSMGHFVLLNALTGSGEEVLVGGNVIMMDSYSARYAGNQSVIIFQFEGREVRLSITGREYDQLHIGSYYGRKMKRGGLGYYYTWGISMWK